MLSGKIFGAFYQSYTRKCIVYKVQNSLILRYVVDSNWNVVAHGDAREGKWTGNWRMEWVANTLHTTSEHGVSSITAADAHTSAASSRLNWRPCRFKWILPYRRKTKSGLCACGITFQLAATYSYQSINGCFTMWNYTGRHMASRWVKICIVEPLSKRKALPQHLPIV